MDRLIAGLAELGITLSPDRIRLFETYYLEMTEWNKMTNLTSVTDYEDVQVKHFLDSLTVTRALDFRKVDKNFRILDVGTGAGMPGMPLKLLYPHIKLSLLEATAKKADFLRYITEKLELDNVEIINERAEGAAHGTEYRERFNLVLSRAVAALVSLAELTLPFCAVGGSFIALKKGDIEPEIEIAGKAIEILGGSPPEVMNIELKEFDDERCLVIIGKTAPTPVKYPRRPGIPEKRPIK